MDFAWLWFLARKSWPSYEQTTTNSRLRRQGECERSNERHPYYYTRMEGLHLPSLDPFIHQEIEESRSVVVEESENHFGSLGMCLNDHWDFDAHPKWSGRSEGKGERKTEKALQWIGQFYLGIFLICWWLPPKLKARWWWTFSLFKWCSDGDKRVIFVAVWENTVSSVGLQWPK